MPPCSPRSSRSRVTSSTNSGTPPVRSVTPSTTSFGSAWRAASSPPCAAPDRGRAARARSCRDASACPRAAGTRAGCVATTNKGASAPRSAMPRNTSSVVGSAQCRSSSASTTGWTSRAGHHPIGQRRQLPTPQFLGRQSRRAFLRQRNVEERREQAEHSPPGRA